jgi:UDP-glucose 4-epimerase
VHVLVTGGAGYIGAYVTRALLAHGYRVTVIDDLSNGHADVVPRAAQLVIRDVGDALCGEIEVIVHLASRIGVADRARTHWTNNVGGTLGLLGRVRARRVIFTSSAAVYGDAAESPISESCALQPLGAYGQTKVAIEQLLEAFGGEWTALRLFNVAGGRERHKQETHLLPLALQGNVAVYGSDRMVRDYVHVEDVADAIVRAVDGPSGIYNIGTGSGTTVREMLDCVERVTGRPVAVSMGAPRAGDPRSLVANIGRARAALGWAPTRSLEEIVRSASAACT